MLDHVPTVRARQLGQALERALRKTGRNSAEMSTLLAWSPSKTSRLLSGKRIASQADIAAFLALCGVVGPQRDEVLDLAERAYEPTWWQDHGGRLPVHLPTLTDNEGAAIEITTFHNALVPDLLRTPDYARALLRSLPNIPAEEVEERVAETSRRQRILDRHAPPRLRVFVDEYVLTRTGAGNEAMSEQAHHLLRMAVRPRIVIRVVPETGGVRDINPFTLLEFADLPSVAYVEHPTSVAFMEREDTIAAYRRVVAELDRLALDEAASRDRLAGIAEQRS